MHPCHTLQGPLLTRVLARVCLQASSIVEQQFLNQIQYSSDLDSMSIAAMMPAPVPEAFHLPDVERLRLHYLQDLRQYYGYHFDNYMDERGLRIRAERDDPNWVRHWEQRLTDPSRRPPIDPGAMQPSYYKRLPDTQVGDDQRTRAQQRASLLEARARHEAACAAAYQAHCAALARPPAPVPRVHGDVADQPISQDIEQSSAAHRGSEAGAQRDDDWETSSTSDSVGHQLFDDFSSNSSTNSLVDDDVVSTVHIVQKHDQAPKGPKAPKQSKLKRWMAKAEKSWGSAAHKVEKPVGRVVDKVGSTFEGWWQSALNKVRSW